MILQLICTIYCNLFLTSLSVQTMKPSDESDVRAPSLEVTTSVLERVQSSEYKTYP